MKAEPNVIWRIQTITVLIPTTALLTVIYLMPGKSFSANIWDRYLTRQNPRDISWNAESKCYHHLLARQTRKLSPNKRYAKALESFTFLRPAPVSSLLAARDLVYAHFQLEAEHQFMEAERIHRGKAKTSNEDASTSNEKVTTSNDRATTGNDRATTSNNVATASNDISTRLQLSTIIETEPPSDNTKWTASYHIAKTKPHQRFAQTFRDPRSRRALVCASTAMIAQQLTGINTIGERILECKLFGAFLFRAKDVFVPVQSWVFSVREPVSTTFGSWLSRYSWCGCCCFYSCITWMSVHSSIDELFIHELDWYLNRGNKSLDGIHSAACLIKGFLY